MQAGPLEASLPESCRVKDSFLRTLHDAFGDSSNICTRVLLSASCNLLKVALAQLSCFSAQTLLEDIHPSLITWQWQEDSLHNSVSASRHNAHRAVFWMLQNRVHICQKVTSLSMQLWSRHTERLISAVCQGSASAFNFKTVQIYLRTVENAHQDLQAEILREARLTFSNRLMAASSRRCGWLVVAKTKTLAPAVAKAVISDRKMFLTLVVVVLSDSRREPQRAST